MTDRHEHVQLKCPQCGNQIEISQNWTAGGFNDYGGYVLECRACTHVFDFRLGRDVNDSDVRSGAKVLDTYLDDDKAAVLARHGL